MNKQEKFLLAVVLIVVVAGGAYYVNTEKNKTPQATVSQVQTAPMGNGQVGEMALSGSGADNALVDTPTSNTNTNTGAVSNNQTTTSTKSTTVSYDVPSGDTEKLTVNVSAKNGVITDVSFFMNPSNPASANWYASFQKSFQKNQLVGKTLSSVGNLSRVVGASLTTAAFNKALGELRG